MAKVNNYIYLYKNDKKSHIILSGIEFKEFARGVSRPLNLLLIRHGFYKGKTHKPSFLTYLPDKYLTSLMEDDIYWYGDFCWVDVKDELSLSKLTDQQIAELLFMAQALRPLASPFFDSVSNRFVYIGHDDGWVTDLYCRNFEEIFNILAVVIQHKTNALLRRKTDLIDNSVLSKIAKMSNQGLYIDFSDAIKSGDSFTLKLKLIGKRNDGSELINKPMITKKEHSLTFQRKQGWFVNDSA